METITWAQITTCQTRLEEKYQNNRYRKYSTGTFDGGWVIAEPKVVWFNPNQASKKRAPPPPPEIWQIMNNHKHHNTYYIEYSIYDMYLYNIVVFSITSALQNSNAIVDNN